MIGSGSVSDPGTPIFAGLVEQRGFPQTPTPPYGYVPGRPSRCDECGRFVRAGSECTHTGERS